jgi:hypothetical protein
MGKLMYFNEERVAQECICCASRALNRSSAIVAPFVAKRIWGYDPVEITEDWGFRDIKPGFAYSLCNSVHCSSCGAVFLDIRFTDHELSLLYEGYRNDAYTSLRDLYEPGYAEKNKFFLGRAPYIEIIEEYLLKSIPLPNKILDWGGDTGKNTPFKSMAEVFDIYDISNKKVVEGATIVSKKDLFLKEYDLIVCANVLEHVPYPSDLLIDIKKAMNEMSVLYIEVPLEDVVRNNQSDLHLFKRHWHEHINFFSEISLRRLLQNIGLEIHSLSEIQVNVAGKSCYIFQIACKVKAN